MHAIGLARLERQLTAATASSALNLDLEGCPSRCDTAIGKRRAVTGATRKPSTAISSPLSALDMKRRLAEQLQASGFESKNKPASLEEASMGDEIAQLLREFEGAMTDFFAGEQRDDTRLYEARMRLYSHPDFGSVPQGEYEALVSRACAAGTAAWRSSSRGGN
jgi:hypothetical protein